MKKYILILLIISSCSSIKKIKKTNSIQEQTTKISEKITEETNEKIDLFNITKSINLDNLEVSVESIKITKKTIDSAGVTITVPEVNITKTTYRKSNLQEVTNIDTTKILTTEKKNTSKDTTNTSLNINTLDLEKESEGIKVIEEIISGIIGGGIFKSIIFVIISLILIVVLFNKLKKNKNEKTNKLD